MQLPCLELLLGWQIQVTTALQTPDIVWTSIRRRIDVETMLCVYGEEVWTMNILHARTFTLHPEPQLPLMQEFPCVEPPVAGDFVILGKSRANGTIKFQDDQMKGNRNRCHVSISTDQKVCQGRDRRNLKNMYLRLFGGFNENKRSSWTQVVNWRYHCVKSVQIRTFSGPYFPVFRLNTEIYSINVRIQSKYRKIQTRNKDVIKI